MNDIGERNEPYALAHGEGRKVNFGIDFFIVASEIQTGSGSAVIHYTTKKGEEPGDHTHPTEDEMFYVIRGEITFRCAGKTFDLKEGGFVFLPHNVKHGYTIPGDDPVHLLVITSPVRDGIAGGWGGFVADMEKPT